MERLSVKIGDTDLTFETGRIAKQAQGSVLVTAGETMVLSAVTVAPDMRPGQDFFPMTVDYREKAYAAGQIPGNFFRREARPSEREILVCRLTDRPLRPLFPKGFLNETQVCQTVFSADNINDPDVLSINAASAAVHISKIPFNGPIGAVRIGLFEEGGLKVNPTIEEMDDSLLDIIVAGTAESILMVEGSAHEVTEEEMIGALEFAHENIKKIVATIEELRAKAGVEKMDFTPPEIPADIVADVAAADGGAMKAALATSGKAEREDATKAAKMAVREALEAKYGDEFDDKLGDIKSALGSLEKRLMRGSVIETSKRIDGRDLNEVRKITIETGVLPRAHGSALFTRGETQALVVATLGTSRDEMRVDELTGDVFRRFYLHYNFPPWSVGETRRIMGPGRREIGHGKLAERALEAVIPETEDEDGNHFPYTIRIVSEITESNGSSSMASVCGGSLAMMDAGVKTAAPVAGIAMGLIKEGDEVRVLSDILGAEDHLGDMDFKVCGTSEGITAFQMDCKIAGVSSDIMTTALNQAKEGRDHILGKMAEALSEARPELNKNAPMITTIKIPVDKIRDIIGPGGKTIREIQSVTGADINVSDDGSVQVAAVDGEGGQAAIDMIENLTAEPEVGKVYHGTVSRLMNFGAFVSVLGNSEGLVHISELAPGHVREVQDVVDIGDEIDVKVIEIDSMGRVNLSKVLADVELGRVSKEEYEAEKAKARESGGGGRGGGDRGGRGGRDGGRGRGGGGGGRGGRDGGGRGRR